jgi:hypothetical protein
VPVQTKKRYEKDEDNPPPSSHVFNGDDAGSVRVTDLAVRDSWHEVQRRTCRKQRG